MRSERASALMLVPAGILVLLLLASISVDSALAYMGQRELQSQADAAANDAVTESIQDLQDGSAARPDAGSVNRIVGVAVEHQYPNGLVVTGWESQLNGDTVLVTLHGRVHYIFSGAVPGAAHFAAINVQSTAQVQFD